MTNQRIFSTLALLLAFGAALAGSATVAIVRNRTTSGGPQPAELERMITEARARTDAQTQWIENKSAHIDSALTTLDQDFSALLPE